MREGWEPVNSIERPLVPFSIRDADRADVDEIAAVHVAAWQSYRGIMPDADIDRRTIAVRTAHWSAWLAQRERTTLVACAPDGRITGFASALLLDSTGDGFDSYLETLYLLPQVKRQGIGGALLRVMSSRFLAAGARTMALRTLRLNPARAFYERLGARLVPTGMALGAGEFDDVVYAFDNLDSEALAPEFGFVVA